MPGDVPAGTRTLAESSGLAPNIIARRHGAPIIDVESISERVYWLAYPHDPNIVKPFCLSREEHLRALGPKLTADQLAILKPQIDSANQWLAEVLNVDLATADTVRKLVVSYHLEHGRKHPTKPEPQNRNTTNGLDLRFWPDSSATTAQMIVPGKIFCCSPDKI